MLARVKVLEEVSKSMADQLGREATVEELAERMQMTVEEVKDIMKQTLDAMTVTGEYDQSLKGRSAGKITGGIYDKHLFDPSRTDRLERGRKNSGKNRHSVE